MKNYLIDWGTMTEDLSANDLEEVKEYVDKNISYTQESVYICDENGNELASRQWWGNKFDPDLYEDGEESDIIAYGDWGYYDEWQEN